MSQARSGREQTGDLSWATQPPQKTCFYCQRPNPGATEPFGGTSGLHGATQIDVCAAGTGCHDGRIFHGPMGQPHQPGEACAICAREGEPQPARRIRRNPGARNGRNWTR